MEAVHTLLPRRLQTSNRMLVRWLLGFFLAALWCFVVFWSWWEHHNLIATTKADLERLTVAVQEQAKGLFKQAEIALLVCQRWASVHPTVDPGTSSEFAGLVEQLRLSSEGLIDIRMVSRNGTLRYIPDKGQAHQTDVSDRDYFKAQFDPKLRGYFIAKPVQSRVTGEWGIPISIPTDGAGADVAVLFAAIELHRIADKFESERAKPNGTIAMLRTDGTFLFRSPMDMKVMGTSLADSASWKQYISSSSKGVYSSAESPVDGASRIVSYAYVPGYPLVVTVTARTDDVLPIWRLHTAILCIVAAIVSLFCLQLGSVLIRSMRSEEEIRNELEHLMLTDSLTNVGNRRMLNRWLEEEVVRANRYKRALTVVFIDIDHFKRINDTYGHGVGDIVLTKVAECIRSQLRLSDHVGRYGGEEFVVLLAETTLAESLPLIERMRAAINALQFTGVEEALTVSAGAAQLQELEDGQQLLLRSDRALYEAKSSGRNRTCLASKHD